MSTLITKNNIKLISKYLVLGIMIILGMFIAAYILEMVFNLGIYFGTFIRNIYNLVCCG